MIKTMDTIEIIAQIIIGVVIILIILYNWKYILATLGCISVICFTFTGFGAGWFIVGFCDQTIKSLGPFTNGILYWLVSAILCFLGSLTEGLEDNE